MKKIITALVVALLVCATATAQHHHAHKIHHDNGHSHSAAEQCEATIHGHITDSRTKEHIPYITVTIDGTTVGTTTDATGHYTLYHAPVGKLKVTVSAIGYASKTKEVNVEILTFSIRFQHQLWLRDCRSSRVFALRIRARTAVLHRCASMVCRDNIHRF